MAADDSGVLPLPLQGCTLLVEVVLLFFPPVVRVKTLLFFGGLVLLSVDCQMMLHCLGILLLDS